MSELNIDIVPTALFDVQVKRIHEYKRQMLNLMHVGWLYGRMKEDPGFLPTPRVVIFSGKAAPGYERAKDVIKAINSMADIINGDSSIDGHQLRSHH